MENKRRNSTNSHSLWGSTKWKILSGNRIFWVIFTVEHCMDIAWKVVCHDFEARTVESNLANQHFLLPVICLLFLWLLRYFRKLVRISDNVHMTGIIKKQLRKWMYLCCKARAGWVSEATQFWWVRGSFYYQYRDPRASQTVIKRIQVKLFLRISLWRLLYLSGDCSLALNSNN